MNLWKIQLVYKWTANQLLHGIARNCRAPHERSRRPQMIVTDINHIEHQVSKTAFFKKAIEFLRRQDIHNMADGRVDIDGQDVFALVLRYETAMTGFPKFEY